MFQSISPGSVDTEIFNTAKFRPSSQTVSSRPALKPEDVAAMVITTLETPPSVEVCLINYNYIIYEYLILEILVNMYIIY